VTKVDRRRWRSFFPVEGADHQHAPPSVLVHLYLAVELLLCSQENVHSLEESLTASSLPKLLHKIPKSRPEDSIRMQRLLCLVIAVVAASQHPSLLLAPDFIVEEGPPGRNREERFPSVDDRVKLYMGNWYEPPCWAPSSDLRFDYFYENRTKGSVWPSLIIQRRGRGSNTTTYQFESIIKPDTVFFLDETVLTDCLDGDNGGKHPFQDRVEVRANMLMYCYDAASSLATALDHVDSEGDIIEFEETAEGPPTLVQFGDLQHSHVYGDLDLPHFKKFRSAATTDMLEHVTQGSECLETKRRALETVHTTTKMQPIIWKFATARHFRMLRKIYREDTPWEQKKAMAIFRGQLTGSRDGYNKHQTDEANCRNLRRCRLVYTHSHSNLIDAKLTSTRNRMPDVLHGVELTAPVTTIRRLLEYKAIIMLEGNDVASGLKWALLSQSLVLMPLGKHTSWAME
jgi:hypothetical protein